MRVRRGRGLAAAALTCFVVVAVGQGLPRPGHRVGSQAPPSAGANAARRDYGRLPVAFEANRGQADPRFGYVARTRGYSLALGPDGAVFDLAASPAATPPGAGAAVDGAGGATAEVRMTLVGADPGARPTAAGELPGRANYLIGDDPARWRVGIPTFARAGYRGVYPGVDMAFHGEQGRLEYDFRVAPGADPEAITLLFAGQSGLRLDRDGGLVVDTTAGSLVERPAVAYQDVDGERRTVAARYAVQPGGRVRFSLGAFDRGRPLIIDPQLVYSTYLGGHRADQGNGIAVDAQGDAFIVGTTQSKAFPHANGTLRGGQDAFVAELSADGSSLLYWTYLGGSGLEEGLGIAVDGSGDAYVTGYTASRDFPVVNAYQGTNPTSSGESAFVSKLNPAGSGLVYSTYLHGSVGEEGYAIAVDAGDSAVVTGITTSPDFPTANAAQPAFDDYGERADAFVTKLDPSGSRLVFSTFLGGGGLDRGTGVALDSAGDVYVVGTSSQLDFGGSPFPSTDGSKVAGYHSVFVAGYRAEGGEVFAKLIGGAHGPVDDTGGQPHPGVGDNYGWAVAADDTGAYVTGETTSFDFPTTPGAYKTSNPNAVTVPFALKVNASGAVQYSTYLDGGQVAGGPVRGEGYGIAVDGSGNAFVVGTTTSPNMLGGQAVCAFQATKQGQDQADAFAVGLNPAGTALVWGTYLGGFLSDDGRAVALHRNGDGTYDALLTGDTGSVDFPTTSNAYQPTQAGNGDAFVTRINTACNNLLALGTPTPLVGDPPVVEHLDPSSGPTTGMTQVTVGGRGLLGTTAVRFDATALSPCGTGAPVSPCFLPTTSDTAVIAYSPPHTAGSVEVTVDARGLTSRRNHSGDVYTYVPPPPPGAPQIRGVVPACGPTGGGTSVSILGTGFSGAQPPRFGGTPAARSTVVSDRLITVTTPPHGAGTVDVTVAAGGLTSAPSGGADYFTFADACAPLTSTSTAANVTTPIVAGAVQPGTTNPYTPTTPGGGGGSPAQTAQAPVTQTSPAQNPGTVSNPVPAPGAHTAINQAVAPVQGVAPGDQGIANVGIGYEEERSPEAATESQYLMTGAPSPALLAAGAGLLTVYVCALTCWPRSGLRGSGTEVRE